MKITGIELTNVRGFKKLEKIEFSKTVNVLVGSNNSGKSTILNSIYQLQRNNILKSEDITVGQKNGVICLYFEGAHQDRIPINPMFDKFQITLQNQQKIILTKNGDNTVFNQIIDHEPNNLIYPFLSKRKAVSFSDAINEQNANSILGNFTNLYSKIDRLVTPQFQPGNSEYIKACNDILGFEISTIAKGNGKQAVYYVHDLKHIPLTAMGEGVTNIVGLITDLCIAKENIFLIEEPENDIHPKALKALINLISQKTDSNQFFISTHSNIAMKHLGAIEGSKVFKISNNEVDGQMTSLRLSSMEEIPNIPSERQKVLEELGYDFFDHDLWKAWLFLEESSAEVIIRDHLIRWFFPKLKYELRTFSAGSTSRIKPKFDDFNKLFVFLHLEPTYKNKVWVYIDGGKEETELINDLKTIYSKSGWKEDNFGQFSQHDFEKYYPYKFQKQVKEALGIKDKQKKRSAKKELLEEVKDWIHENDKEAKEAFKESASEIIEVLKIIKKELK
jgi:predicted ATPase